jgi:hypothetical protein
MPQIVIKHDGKAFFYLDGGSPYSALGSRSTARETTKNTSKWYPSKVFKRYGVRVRVRRKEPFSITLTPNVPAHNQPMGGNEKFKGEDYLLKKYAPRRGWEGGRSWHEELNAKVRKLAEKHPKARDEYEGEFGALHPGLTPAKEVSEKARRQGAYKWNDGRLERQAVSFLQFLEEKGLEKFTVNSDVDHDRDASRFLDREMRRTVFEI